MKIEHSNDVTRYVFRQSWLNEYLICPERARLEFDGITVSGDTAESAIGTCVHTAAERFKRGDTPSQALEAARGQFWVLSEAPGFRWVKVKTTETALKHIETCFETWLRVIEPKLGEPWGIELPFKLKFSCNDQRLVAGGNWTPREIWLQGTIDFIDAAGLWDWKTCSRLLKYTTDGWQLKRWAIQPTVYTWAATQLGLVDAEGPVPFTYGAMARTGGSALLTVYRDQSHWSWLERLCWNVVNQSNSTEWPLNDQHALCSEDWCPAWSMCKGAHFPSEHQREGAHIAAPVG